MTREKRKQEDVFNDFQELSIFVRLLGGIVQNSDQESSDEDLLEWSDNVNKAINKLSELREDVVRFYKD